MEEDNKDESEGGTRESKEVVEGLKRDQRGKWVQAECQNRWGAALTPQGRRNRSRPAPHGNLLSAH